MKIDMFSYILRKVISINLAAAIFNSKPQPLIMKNYTNFSIVC